VLIFGERIFSCEIFHVLVQELSLFIRIEDIFQWLIRGDSWFFYDKL